jgi:hypothetical protein
MALSLRTMTLCVAFYGFVSVAYIANFVAFCETATSHIGAAPNPTHNRGGTILSCPNAISRARATRRAGEPRAGTPGRPCGA